MRFDRLLSAMVVLSAATYGACGGMPTGAGEPESEVGTVSEAVTVKKTFTRKIYVHMMPWFQVGGGHWSMNKRNPGTGVASYYKPMIGEYASNDGNVIEYQLLLMKYAGIDGVLIDWPGLSGAYDLPQNKAATDTIVGRTAGFGLEFGIVYEDQYAASVDAAKNDMSYVRDNFFSKANHIKINNLPALTVFGPQKFKTEGDWNNILSVFTTNPMFFPLWYNDSAGKNADGKFAWVAQNGLKGLKDFNDGLDGTDHGWKIPVVYPGFNSFYAEGGWQGPTWKLEYDLKPDGTRSGVDVDTLRSSFDSAKYAGEPIQIATWNDYGEGTQIEPTDQFQYRHLAALQKLVGVVYDDQELKIIKTLFDKRRSGGDQGQLDQASQALANLDVVKACTFLGCTAPDHPNGAAGGSTGSAGSTNGAAGSTNGAAGSTNGTAGSTNGAGGTTAAGGTGAGNAPSSSGTSNGSAGRTSNGTAGSDAGSGDDSGGGCSVRGTSEERPSAWLLAAGLLGFAAFRRSRRDLLS